MKIILGLFLVVGAQSAFAESEITASGQGSLTESRAASLALIDDLLKDPAPTVAKVKPPAPAKALPAAPETSDSHR